MAACETQPPATLGRVQLAHGSAPIKAIVTVQRASARRAQPAPFTDKVKLTLTLYLNREQAERLAARAIRDGKNLEAIIAEICEAAPN